MTEQSNPQGFSRKVAFLLCLLFAGLGGGVGLWGGLHWKQPVAPSKQPVARQVVKTASAPSAQTWKMCAVDASPTIFGAFRELDCWITHLRTSKPNGYLLDKKVYLKFTELFQRIKKMPITELTPGHWRMFYTLGTRLYPRQNQWAAGATIPVYEMNGHHHAFRFWLKESTRRKLGSLFHLDSHEDMSSIPSPVEVMKAAKDIQKNRNVKRAWHLIIHTVKECSMPVTAGVLAGLFTNVVWGKTIDVDDVPTFVNKSFFFGLPRKGVPDIEKISGLSSDDKYNLREKINDLKESPRRYRLYYDPKNETSGKPVAWNYYWIYVGASQRPVKKKFLAHRPFRLSILNTDDPIDANGKGKGAATFQKLLQSLPRGKFTLDLDIDYFASLDSSPGYDRGRGDDPNDGFDKKAFLENRKDIDQRLQDFENVLLALKKNGRVPSMINIADSTFLWFALDRIATAQSEYTPIEHAAYLRRHVRVLLRRVYGRDVYNGRPKVMQDLASAETR